MAEFKPINAPQAWRDIQQGALLVSGLEDMEGWYRTQVSGAVSFQDFRQKSRSLRPDQEVIFYCDCDDDGAAIKQARSLAAQGFSNVKYVDGGFEALKACQGGQQAGSAAAGPAQG